MGKSIEKNKKIEEEKENAKIADDIKKLADEEENRWIAD